ncbi:hypothetical protein GGF43_000313 [Coemansia sp. RSA 2618]|nr:hypothetical protein GGF43_000313 [Coemansia sp. RSA 2618]
MCSLTVAIFLVYLNRTYIPLRSKNIPLIYTLYVTTLLWFIGDIFTYFPTLVPAPSRAICILTMSWLRMSFGIFSIVSCHIFRIYQYICSFEWRVRAVVGSRYFWRPVFAWSVLPLAYGALASTLPADRGGNAYIREERMCVSDKPLYFVAVAFLIVLLVCWIVATLRMKRIYVCFSEFREMLAIIACTVVIIVLQVVLRWVPRIGDNSVAFNAVASMSDVLVCMISMFVLVSRALWHCYVDRDEYLRYFLHKLKRENRQTEYEMANGGEGLGRISTSIVRGEGGGGVLGVMECEMESPTEWRRSVDNVLFNKNRSVDNVLLFSKHRSVGTASYLSYQAGAEVTKRVLV